MGEPNRIARLISLLLAVWILAVPSAEAQRSEVQIKSDFSGGGGRIVLTHTRQLVYSVQEKGDTILVIYAEPVMVERSRQKFDSNVLQRYEFRGEDTLAFETGKEFRAFQSYELHNPFRLILDIQGSAPAVMSNTGAFGRVDSSRTVVVIDPGHGGVEDGAIGRSGLKEKDVALDLARKLKQTLQQGGEVNVVLTRDEDRLLSLDERTAIANHNRADLFLSIHLNASPRSKAKGAETYFLSAEATDDDARTLAALESKASKVDPSSVYSGELERKDLDLVLWDLAQNRFLAESSGLAESVQRQLNELTGTRNRGVRQAPFRVLMGATMPAILVEVGFISNRDEEQRFQSNEYRNQVVDAIAAAVREYLRKVDHVTAPQANGNP